VSGERWCNVAQLLFRVMLTGDVGQVEQQHREAAIQLLPIACACVTPGRALPLPVHIFAIVLHFFTTARCIS